MVENTQKIKQNRMVHFLITLLPSVLSVKMLYTSGSRDSNKSTECLEIPYSESMITLACKNRLPSMLREWYIQSLFKTLSDGTYFTFSMSWKIYFFRFTTKQNNIRKRAEKKRGKKKSLIPVKRNHMFTRLEDCASCTVIVREGRCLRKKMDLIFI